MHLKPPFFRAVPSKRATVQTVSAWLRKHCQAWAARYAAVMMTLPKHTKLVLALLAVLPVYFMIAALGTKFGIWDWKVGLMTLTLGGGLIILALIALVALVSLILAIRTVPRAVVPLVVAILGLVAPGAALMAFMGEGAMAAENPIHDIAPDTANPPAFSPDTLKARTAAGANPLSD